jgi:hypothetical protein
MGHANLPGSVATNLHHLGVEDREIQAILRHSDIRMTQAIYIKSVPAGHVNAMGLMNAVLAALVCLGSFLAV